MIYVHTKFHMPTSNGALAIAIKPKANKDISTAAMLFYILHKYCRNKGAYFLKIYYSWTSETKWLHHTLCGKPCG
jgi:hypothetical protein